MEELLYLCMRCKETFAYNYNAHSCVNNNNATEDVQNYLAPEVSDVEPSTSYPKITEKKLVTKSKRDGWKDEDIKRLLDIYIKNFKALPYKAKYRNHFLWDRVMRELKQYGDFSRFLVQSKLKKLKNTCRTITNENTVSYEWPYYQKVMEIMRLESDSRQNAGNEEGTIFPEEDTESDNGENDDNVQGLQRWTVKETRHLIQVYMKYLPKFFIKGQRRKILWNEVLGELLYDLPKRFSMYQIRAKIRNVQITYRSIIEKKRKKSISYWPLFKDVERLAKLEKKLSEGFYNSFIDQSIPPILDEDEKDADNSTRLWQSEEKASDIRWNHEETEELLNEYKSHLAQALCASSYLQNCAWTEITEKVNLIRRRKITPSQAQEKIDSLKNAVINDEHDESPIIVTFVRNILEEEKSLLLHPEIETDEVPEKKLKPDPLEDDSDVYRKPIPSWYVQYDKNAKRRHREKMDVYRNIITVLEKIIRPSDS